MKEIKELRGAREKHFKKEDGSYIAYQYDHNIHYLKNGKYEEKENKLIEKEKYYENKANDLKVQFLKKQEEENLLNVKYNDQEIKLDLKNKKINPNIKENTIIYKEILKNIDICFEVYDTKIKDTIYLKKPMKDYSNLIYEIKTKMHLKQEDDGRINIYNGKKVLFAMPKPILFDKNNKTYPVKYRLERKEEKYYLSYSIEEEILRKEEIYPLKIDPIIEVIEDDSMIDTYIFPGDTEINRNEQDVLKVGIDEQNRIYRSLLKFQLPKIGTGYDIVDAHLFLNTHPTNFNHVYQDHNHLLTVHAINQVWEEETACWDTMHNKYDERIEDFQMALRTLRFPVLEGGFRYEIQKNDFDITNLVKKWYAGKENNGIMLKLYKEIKKEDDKEYCYFSKNNQTTIAGQNPKPILMITYQNKNGLENYMTYQELGYKRGISYINNLTGNIINVFPINQTVGNTLNLSLIYNTNDVVLENEYGLPKGYKWNYYETIKEVNYDNVCLEYVDSDGTLHYFRNYNNEITDEDGLGFKIEKKRNSYILIDRENNRSLFMPENSTYYLTKVEKADGKKIDIKYQNQKIVKLIDENNEEINIKYETDKINITSSYLTTKISLENGKIQSIENKFGTTTFIYNEKNLIDTIIDIDGLKTNYLYYPTIPYRIQKIRELGLKNEEGNILEFIYEFNVTRVKDGKGRTRTYSFNNQGNTIGITNLTEESNFKNSYGILKEYNKNEEETSSKLKNKLTLATTLFKYTNNKLTDTSFENNTYSNSTSEYARSGNTSLKITEEYTIELPKTETNNYTFSAYFKTLSSLAKIELYENEKKKKEKNILISNDFQKESITDYFDETKSYKIKITANNGQCIYMDDMQFEEGEAANYYNYVENSDFKNGLIGWNYNGVNQEGNTYNKGEIVVLPNGSHAFKISCDPDSSHSIEQSFKMKGKKNDSFRLSFWYKNEGIRTEEYAGNFALVSFNYDDTEFGHGLIPCTLNPHASEWQFFQTVFVAEEDYNGIYLNFISQMNANDFYITHVTLTKDVENTSYKYDDEGNLQSIIGKTQEKTNFAYDKNNQLIAMFEPKGNHYAFEYDNKDKTRVLQGITKKGISNKIEYDQWNNPIKTKIENNDKTIIDHQSFFIRLKGTKKYLETNPQNFTLILKEPSCSQASFSFTKEEEKYTIQSSTLQLYITNDGKLSKSEKGSFIIVENENGSVTFKTEENALTYENGILKIKPYESNQSNQEFYLEPIKNREKIENHAEYTNDGKFIKTTTDALGKVTKYDIDSTTGLTNSITDPNQITTNYIYNSKDQIIKVEKEGKETNYSYNDQDLLSKITCENKEYNFTYDNFLNTKEVKINNQVLVSNEYEENNGNLISSLYGNKAKVNYTYDELDRLKTLEKNNKIYTHIYDNQNRLTKITEKDTNYNYYYDLADRLSKYEINSNLENQFTINYEYDQNNNVTKKTYIHKETKEQIEYIYDEDDSLIQVNFNNQNLNYIYDPLGRLKEKNIDNQLPATYEYDRNGNKASLILKRITIGNTIYDYTYDNLYNITDIYKNKELMSHYEYDEFNELLKEDNYLSNKTIKYTYNNVGNILKKQEYQINTNILIKEDNYEYNNPNWKDQLTKYNDTKITYDEIGNPITIGDVSLSWNARELQSYQDSMSKIEYFYNKEGIRTKKRVNNVETNYFIENSNIIIEETNGNIIYYIRTGEQELLGMKYNKETYYYQKNYQGDITGIYNQEYKLIATYEYDSYGKILSIKDVAGNNITDENHIANKNPFRYRSYYYDKETKLYYLNSRYYNPEWGRFLNADNYISTDTGLLGYNMYAYTNNNYISSRDPNGKGLFGLFIGMAVALTAIVINANIVKNKAKKEIQQVQTNNYKKDKITDYKFEKTLHTNAQNIKNKTQNMSFVEKLNYIAKTSNNNTENDLKRQEEWKNSTIYYDNHWMEPQDIGNYHFGYIGRATGIPTSILTTGAGIIQFRDHGLKTIQNCFTDSICDDPRDTYYIRLGAIAYDQGY